MSILGTYKFLIEELQFSWRLGSCVQCGCSTVGKHNVAYHRCVDAAEDTNDLTLTKMNFSLVERVLYAHDILEDLSLAEPLRELDMVLMQLALISFPVRPIIKNGRATLVKILRVQDIVALDKVLSAEAGELGYIFVPENSVDDAEFKLTLAFDILLKHYSLCDPALLPVAGLHQRAWITGQFLPASNLCRTLCPLHHQAQRCSQVGRQRLIVCHQQGQNQGWSSLVC